MTAPKRWIRMLAASAVLLLMGSLPSPGLADKPPEVAADGPPLSSAARLNGEVQVSPFVTPTDWDNYLPAIAYNSKHRQFLIVWHAKRADGCRDIWGRRVSEAGQLLSYFNIASGPCPENRIQPAVAYNAKDDNYLVVWMYNPSGTSTLDQNEIRARTVAWDGSTMGGENQLIVWANRSFWTPHVAWDSVYNEYMVVWNANDTTTGKPSDVAHAILDHNGVRVWGAIISSASYPQQVDVTFNVAKVEFFVVWRRMWTPGDGDIMGARLDNNNGFVVTPPGVFPVSDPITDQKDPRVATNGQNRYVVVWSQVYDPTSCCDWGIRGQEVDVDGNLVGSDTIIAQTLEDETAPAVIARPGSTREYLTAWQVAAASGAAIQAWRWGDASVTSLWLLDVASAAFWDNTQPAVAVGGSAFLLAYASDALGDPTVHNHIYMRRYVPYATYLPVTRR